MKTKQKNSKQGEKVSYGEFISFPILPMKKPRSNDTSLAISLEPLGDLLQAAVCLRQNIPKEPWLI